MITNGDRVQIERRKESGDNSRIETDDTIRLRHYTIFVCLGVPLTLLFGIFHLVKANYLLSAMIFFSGAALLLGWMLLKGFKKDKYVYRINALLYGALLVYMLHIGGSAGSKALWLFTFPLIVSFLLGTWEGLVWNAAIFLVAIGIFSGLTGGLGSYAYHPDFKLRFVLTFAIICCIAALYEYLRCKYHNELRSQADKGQQYLDVAGAIFLAIDNKQKVTMINNKGCEVLGYKEEDILGKDWFEIFLPEKNRSDIKAYFDQLISGEIEDSQDYFENPVVTASGDERLIAWHNSILKDKDGNLLGTLSSGTDITERRMAEESLRSSEERYNTLFYQSNDMVFLHDLEGNLLDANRKAMEALGYERSRLLSLKIPDLHPPEAAGESKKVFDIIKRDGYAHFEIPFLCRNGTIFPAEVSSSVFELSGKQVVQGLARDISERKHAEEEIRFLAYYDSLTGLPNRTFYKELLGNALKSAHRNNKIMAVMFMDIDGFKRINDTLGHTAGDKLLKMVGSRIANAVRKSDHIARSKEADSEDIISRVGGDEFIILLKDMARPEDAAVVAERLLKQLAEPYLLEGREVFISVSVGIALYPSDGEDGEVLLKNADIAMYNVKEHGKNDYRFYSKSMNESALERLSLENELRKALENEELFLHYQPKVVLKTGDTAGVEALVRWNHPSRGLVPPGEFIPIAEDSGIIVPLGEWVLKEACSQFKRWAQQGYNPVCMSVNLSNRQFKQKGLVQKVEDILNETGMDPGFLELEITESTLMEDPEVGIAVLEACSSMGISIAIDDFGTGYSSLEYLKNLPVHALKIDRAFVMNIHLDSNDEAIAKAIVAMAHSLSLKVIAEGVETDEQFFFLRDLDCDEAQGYLFSKPLPADEMENYFARTG